MLEIKNLEKAYGKRKALNGINCHLEKGEIYGLLGPNGAGKTTTLKILAGLLLFDSGEIRINGSLYHRSKKELKRQVAYVPDQPFVYEKLTGEEHMHFYADLYKIPDAIRQEKVDFFFKFFEFESYRHELVETYSTGTRQKLLISQAFLVEPAIFLFDEPLSSIDPLVSRKFRNYLKEIAKTGKIVLFATHILPLAQEVSSRLGVIIDGRIITEGTLDELLEISAGQNKSLDDFYYETVMNYEKSF